MSILDSSGAYQRTKFISLPAPMEYVIYDFIYAGIPSTRGKSASLCRLYLLPPAPSRERMLTMVITTEYAIWYRYHSKMNVSTRPHGSPHLGKGRRRSIELPKILYGEHFPSRHYFLIEWHRHTPCHGTMPGLGAAWLFRHHWAAATDVFSTFRTYRALLRTGFAS